MLELKTIIDPVIQRSGYFCHLENLLLTILKDTYVNWLIREFW